MGSPVRARRTGGADPSLAGQAGPFAGNGKGSHFFNEFSADKVDQRAESPLPLDEAGIPGFIDRSLARFGLAVETV